ncbi:hypothetical protein ACFOOK_28530 [Micromonospora krabiensis]|uniref:hypothetical protein n=1 Tax=Micromonospora krabiensis TaxID=307121 RepID=UPI00360EAB7F
MPGALVTCDLDQIADQIRTEGQALILQVNAEIEPVNQQNRFVGRHQHTIPVTKRGSAKILDQDARKRNPTIG